MYQAVINNKNIFKNLILLSVLVMLFSAANAQINGKNLVPNSSFELHKGKAPVIKTAKPWLNVGTVDYFLKIDKQDTTKHKGPHSGTAYVGLRFQSKYKEYAYVKLLEPLVQGKTYFFTMYVRFLDISTVSVKQLGVYFSNDPFKIGMQFNEEGLVDSTYDKGITGDMGWVPINGRYTSKGGEKFLIVGNFRTNTKEDFVRVNKWEVFETREAYYYLDDVTLIDTTGSFLKKPAATTPVSATTAITTTDTSIKATNEFVYKKTIEFENGSSKLQNKSSVNLEQLAALFLSNSSIEIQVNGYADSQGKESINIQLSKERAKIVYDYFISKGIKNPITYKGLGSLNPIAPNDSAENRAKNRRVEVIVIKKY